MPSHPERVRRSYYNQTPVTTPQRPNCTAPLGDLLYECPVHGPSSIVTGVLSQFGRDIRYLLEHTDRTYCDADMLAVRRRLAHLLELGL